jgi:hypothetical protein
MARMLFATLLILASFGPARDNGKADQIACAEKTTEILTTLQLIPRVNESLGIDTRADIYDRQTGLDDCFCNDR